MESSKFTGEMEKIKAKWTQVSLKNVLKVKDPKLSRVLIVQNNVYAAVHGAIGEDRLEETCSFLLGNHHTVILTNSYSCSRILRLAANIANIFFECLSAKICCSWSSDKFANLATCEFFSALLLLLVGSGPNRSMPIEKLGSSSLVSSIFQREGKLHCSLTGRKLWSQVEKMLTSSYLHTGVRN